MFFRVHMKNITYKIYVSRNTLIKDALVCLCETLCYKTIRNEFGSVLDVNLTLSACSLADKDALWVFDKGELWQFQFLVGGCSFVVLLQPFKQIDDLFAEAQRVFNSLYKTERWKDVRYFLHCRKDENIWSVWQSNAEKINIFSVFTIFNDKDTIYCCNQHVKLQQTMSFLFFPNGDQLEYEHLRLSLQVIEICSKFDNVDSDGLMWKWMSFGNKNNNTGFYLKTRNSLSPISEECLEIPAKENVSTIDSGYFSDSVIGEIKQGQSKSFCELHDTNMNVQSAPRIPLTPTLKSPPQSVIVLDEIDDKTHNSPSQADRTGNLEYNVTFLNGDVTFSVKQDVLEEAVATNEALGNKRKLTKEYIEAYIEVNLRRASHNITFKKLYKKLRKKFDTDILKWRKFIKQNFYEQKKTAQPSENILVDTRNHLAQCLKHSSLTKKDIITLNPGCWINDQIINVYLKLVMTKSKKSIYAFNTFFHTCLRTRGYAAVCRWTKKKVVSSLLSGWEVDIFQKDLVLFPIHNKNHWSLAVASIPEKIITCYNPLYRMTNIGFQNVLRDYLNEESVTKQYSNMKWQLKTSKDNPIQENTDDCGVFVCLYAKCLAFDIPMNFTQNNIPLARKLITKEICSEKMILKIY